MSQIPHFDLVIIGFGMASARLLQCWLEVQPAPRRCLVIGEEPTPAYNRVLLPQLLEDPTTELALGKPVADLRKAGVQVRTGDAVSRIEPSLRHIHCQSGAQFSYQQLVLATGAEPQQPAQARASALAPFTLSLRTLADAQRLQALAPHSHVVVQGGGFIALEAAAALSLQHRVTLCHRGPYLMNRQLDASAAQMLQQALADKGIEVLLQQQISDACRQGDGLALTLRSVEASTTGASNDTAPHVSTLHCDLWLTALGIQPRVELAKACGLRVRQGIVVNDQLQTSDPAIFALGECCEHQGETFGLVAPAYQQAAVLAQVLAGKSASFTAQQVAMHLKISGVAISAMGDVAACSQDDSLQSLAYHDASHGDYRRIWLKEGQIVGAVLCGDTSLSGFYQQQLTQAQVQPPQDLVNHWLFAVA